MLREQADAQTNTITELKREIKEIEMNKANQERQKAEIEYNCRAAEYNVEILKNQLENVNTEMLLLKAKNEKVTKSFGYLRQSYIRLKDDVAYYKKGKNPPRRGRSQSNTPI